MIELDIGFGHVDHQLIDKGFFQEAALGGPTERIDRAGSRYSVTVSAGPFCQDEATRIVSKLLRAKSQGLRIPFPLQWDQGSPGAPVVDGVGQTGRTVELRGFTPGYTAKEGYWLSIEDADGNHALYNVAATARAEDGTVTLAIEPELKRPYADGAKVHIAKPYIQGWMIADVNWQSLVHMSVPINFSIVEKR